MTTLAARPVRAFSPEQVAGLSAWYDPSDLSTLFQDMAMTLPVTAAGQSVAAMADKSGNGRHMVQAMAAARPVYGTDGAYHWLQFDGVDDRLAAAPLPIGGTAVFAGVAFAPNPSWPGTTLGGVLADASWKNGGIQFGWEYGYPIVISNSFTTESKITHTGFSSDPSRRNVLGLFTGSTPFAYLHGRGFVTVAPSYASSVNMPLTMGQGTQGGREAYFPGRVHGAVYAAANRIEAEALLRWVGRTCGLRL